MEDLFGFEFYTAFGPSGHVGLPRGESDVGKSPAVAKKDFPAEEEVKIEEFGFDFFFRFCMENVKPITQNEVDKFRARIRRGIKKKIRKAFSNLVSVEFSWQRQPKFFIYITVLVDPAKPGEKLHKWESRNKREGKQAARTAIGYSMENLEIRFG